MDSYNSQREHGYGHDVIVLFMCVYLNQWLFYEEKWPFACVEED